MTAENDADAPEQPIPPTKKLGFWWWTGRVCAAMFMGAVFGLFAALITPFSASEICSSAVIYEALAEIPPSTELAPDGYSQQLPATCIVGDFLLPAITGAIAGIGGMLGYVWGPRVLEGLPMLTPS